MIKLKDILFEGKISKSQIKKMRKDFEKTGKLPPHLQKISNLMKKDSKIKDFVVPGLEWMAEEKIKEGKADKSFNKMISIFRKEFRRLNDDDSYQLGVKLKQWFNKNVL